MSSVKKGLADLFKCSPELLEVVGSDSTRYGEDFLFFKILQQLIPLVSRWGEGRGDVCVHCHTY